MKLSLSWIFDHIASQWQHHDIASLIQKLHATTAEVEAYEYVNLDLDSFTVAHVSSKSDEKTVFFSLELSKELSITGKNEYPLRSFYLLKNDLQGWRMALLKDFGSSKEGLVPELFITPDEFAGSWKKKYEKEDYLITIGNTSITHRPDLWSHRGFAREVAALLGCPLHDERHFLTDVAIKKNSLEKNNKDLSLALEASECSVASALVIPHITWNPSMLFMASRLARVDSKPIDAIVDATNYVMFDIGQPMHAFEGSFFSDKKLVITHAQAGQTIMLLDGQSIELTSQSLIITNGQKPLSLAGVMGGAESAVSQKTKSIVIEAAHYDAASIRTSAAHYKLRTESSTRFEKKLDPQQTTTALQRFLHLLNANSIEYTLQGPIIATGYEYVQHSIHLAHDMIEKKLGCSISYDFVMATLNALGFSIHYDLHKNEYTAYVPSWRAKDVIIAEDLIEEVGRYFGYDNIPHELPCLQVKPTRSEKIEKIAIIKQFLAFAARSHEVRNYALYDEEFLKTIRWQPPMSLSIKNPVSEQMVRLVTSLIPHLFKTVQGNKSYEECLSFFEWNKIWPQHNFLSALYGDVREVTSCAGLVYAEKKTIDFYYQKDILDHLFKLLNCEISWIKADKDLPPWYHPYKTAFLVHKEKIIGVAGSVNPGFMAHFLPGDAFLYEFNGDVLLDLIEEEQTFTPLAKYQDTWRDISMLVPLSVTVESLVERIKKASSSIFDIKLMDFFQKQEWNDRRAVTIRFFARDANKTLSSDEIDRIYEHVVTALKPAGVEIR
jgi:phenylalanyl-tRNA synthetase beta chain